MESYEKLWQQKGCILLDALAGAENGNESGEGMLVSKDALSYIWLSVLKDISADCNLVCNEGLVLFKV